MTDDRRRELREAFIEARGFWTPLWDGLLDLDAFKAFNDYYGYARGDVLIRFTASLLHDVIERLGGDGDPQGRSRHSPHSHHRSHRARVAR
jgi:GGDEF domain-containing protein